MASHGGKMKSMSINGVKIYTISSQQRSVASWLNPKKRKDLRKDKSYRESVELIQDLRFETATTKIKLTQDGEFFIAAGIYPPQVKVYELREFSMKFERHLDAEIVDFEVLSDDYSKLAFLCADRSINLHAKYGKHYSLRIPRMGRDIAYDCWSCDLLCAASGPDLYRINLEQGRFLSSLNTQSPALNVVARSKVHGLVACGGDDGAVECFDTRTKSSVGRINAVSHANDIDEEVSAIEFDDNGGYVMGVGSNAGKVFLYDLRSSRPLRVKDHMYGSPILDIKWHNTLNLDRPKLITTDCHAVKIWDPETGEAMTSIEPTAGTINDICVFNGSGLMLLALDSSQIPAYYLPALGPVPKWCASLEGLTEELEEGGQTSIYDNYKFLTKEELERLSMTSLIGTNVLRAYMHGFFVDYRLYKKAVAMANPFAYEEYKEKQKQEKMDKMFGSRITMVRKLPKVKVNQELAQSIVQNGEGEEERKDMEGQEIKKKSKKKKAVLGEDIFEDDRFASLFQKEDFQIDRTSKEYLALHPMDANKQQSLLKEHFEEVPDTEDQVSAESDESSEGLSDDDKSTKRNRSNGPRLFEVKDERHAEAYFKSVSLAKEESLPLGERVKALEQSNQVSGMADKVKFGPGGSRELSFFPKGGGKSRGKNDEVEDEDEAPRGKRRGIQSLKLNPDRSWSGGRGRGRGRGRGGGGGRGGGCGRGRRGPR